MVRIVLVAVLVTTLTACSAAGDGAPSAAGQYDVQRNSVHFDGDRYRLYWADHNGSLHQLDTRKLRLVRDDRTFLEVPQGGDPILHLREDEPITVDGQDHQGAFSSPWFPFLLGATLGSTFGGRGGGQTIIINNPAPGESGTYGPSTPAYRYPPTGSFGRDDELHGSLDSSKPSTPDYSRIQPAPYATSARAAGTGGGTAASNKAGGSIGGTAASSKGGFAQGDRSFSAHGSSGASGSGVGAGSRGALSGGGSLGGTSSKPSTGVSGSKGIGGARAGSGGRR